MSSADMDLMHVTAVTQADNTQFDSSMKKSEEVATATGRAITKAKEAEAKAVALNAKLAATAVTEQSMKIIQAYNAQTAASKDYRQAQALARTMNDREAAVQLEAKAYQQLTAAKLATATASKIEAEAAEATVLTQRSAVSAVVRATEGQQGIRAVEGFLTSLPGVGSALQGIFPLIGGTMFVSLLAKMGAELYDLEQKGKHAGEEMGRGFAEMNGKLAALNDETELQNSKLEDQIAKLERHPSDGLKTALLEASHAATELQNRLEGALKTEEALLKEKSVGVFEAALSGTAPTSGSNKEIVDLQKAVTDQGAAARLAYRAESKAARDDQDKREAATKAYYGRMDEIAADAARKMRARATDIAKLQKDNDASNATLDKFGLGGAGLGNLKTDFSTQRNAFEGAAVNFDELQRSAQDAYSAFEDDAKLNNLRGDGKPPKEKKERPEDRFNLTDYESFGRENDRISEALGKTWAELNKRDEEAAKVQAEGQAKIDEANRKAAETNRRYAESLAGVDVATARAVLAMNELTTQHNLATAAISRPEALDQTAAQHKVAYQAQLNDLELERTALTPEDIANGKGENINEKRKAIQGEMDRTALQDSWAKFEATGIGGAVTALQELAREATDVGARMRDFISSSVNEVNGGIVKTFTEANWKHKGQWGDIGHSIFTSAAGAGVRGLEGVGLKALGINGQWGSSPAHALWTKSADAIKAMGSGVASSVTHMFKGGGAASGAGWLSTLLNAVPHFDVGTNNVTRDMLAVVHQGEAIIPKAYNDGGGSGYTHNGDIHVDARGNANTAEVEYRLRRVVRQEFSQLRSDVPRLVKNHNDRVGPSGKV